VVDGPRAVVAEVALIAAAVGIAADLLDMAGAVGIGARVAIGLHAADAAANT
jgi:hypothetical protein